MRDVEDSLPRQRMPHGYCNETSREGDQVTKQFLGPHADTRAATEARVLRTVAAVVPVPRLVFADDTHIVCDFVPGRHGQDVLVPDLASAVLAACGRILAAIHAVPLAALATDPPRSHVLVHGDFGPQNLLFDTGSLDVAAVLDWEWSHVGQPIEDLAWCEWIVRSHHASCVDALPHLYYGYGAAMPPWPQRQAAMLTKCRLMRDFGLQRRDGSASLWQRRTAVTAAWRG